MNKSFVHEVVYVFIFAGVIYNMYVGSTQSFPALNNRFVDE